MNEPFVVTAQEHMDLVKLVIELKTDVKHIDQRITDLVIVAAKNNERICNLEVYKDQTIGETRGVHATTVAVSILISTLAAIAAVIVSWMVGH